MNILWLNNKAGCGVILQCENKEDFALGLYLGNISSNAAEYYGAIYGIYLASFIQPIKCTLIGDSQLVIKQLKKEY